MNPSARTQIGFTLIELVVVIAIFAVMSLAAVVLVSNILTGSNKQAALLANIDQARSVSFRVMQELRNAVPSSTGSYALELCDAQQLIFYTNLDGGTDIERVRYYMSNGKLYRGVVKPTGSPLSYNVGSEVSTVVQNDIGNGGSPLFTYYPDTYDGTTGNALAVPANVTQVRFVRLNLTILNKAGQIGTNTYTVTAGASIRNLKTNLGN
jgi:prepilin-type N-terminal cleavage/methylation domain-containing protein